MASRYLALKQQRYDLTAEARGLDLGSEEGKARFAQVETEIAAVDADLLLEEKRREMERTAPAGVAPAAPLVSGVHDRAGDAPWRGFGEQLAAIAEAGRPGGIADPRLYRADISGASVSVPSDGGYLVRQEYTTSLLDSAVQASVLASLCRQYPVGEGNDGIEAPMIDETSRATGSRWGGVQVYRISEADTVTAKKPAFGLFQLRLEDMMGLAYATERLLRDAAQLEAVFRDAFTSEFAFKLDDEIVRGTGAGQCLGILNSGATVSVSKETGQAAATVVVENLSKMWARMWSRSKRNAAWFINTDVNPQLDQLALTVGTGGLEPRFVTYDAAGAIRIKGKPVVELEQCESLGTVGDVLLLDLSQYILLTKGGLQSAQSLHVRFLYNERTFRWVYPIIGKPKWVAPLTPYKGTGNTQSPFISLATRS